MVADAMTLSGRSVRPVRRDPCIPAMPSVFADLAARNGNADAWPDLIEPVRAMLQATGKPYVIENVDGSPLQDYVVF